MASAAVRAQDTVRLTATPYSNDMGTWPTTCRTYRSSPPPSLPVRARGRYGDVIEEIDHNIGRLIATLEEEGLAENNVFVFTSDNGPWLTFGEDCGSAGLLRQGKGPPGRAACANPASSGRPTTLPRPSSPT